MIPPGSLKKTEALITRSQKPKHHVADQPSQPDDEFEEPLLAIELVIASMTQLIRGHREMLELLRGMDERLQQLERRTSAKPPVLDRHAQAALDLPPRPMAGKDVSEKALLADLESLVREVSQTGEH